MHGQGLDGWASQPKVVRHINLRGTQVSQIATKTNENRVLIILCERAVPRRPQAAPAIMCCVFSAYMRVLGLYECPVYPSSSRVTSCGLNAVIEVMIYLFFVTFWFVPYPTPFRAYSKPSIRVRKHTPHSRGLVDGSKSTFNLTFKFQFCVHPTTQLVVNHPPGLARRAFSPSSGTSFSGSYA